MVIFPTRLLLSEVSLTYLKVAIESKLGEEVILLHNVSYQSLLAEDFSNELQTAILPNTQMYEHLRPHVHPNQKCTTFWLLTLLKIGVCISAVLSSISQYP